jgi:hypothetical protein
MDASGAAAQPTPLLAAPLPVHAKPPPEGAVEPRAVEETAETSAPNAEHRQPVYDPGQAVLRLLNESLESIASTNKQARGPDHVDTYG